MHAPQFASFSQRAVATLYVNPIGQVQGDLVADGVLVSVGVVVGDGVCVGVLVLVTVGHQGSSV